MRVLSIITIEIYYPNVQDADIIALQSLSRLSCLIPAHMEIMHAVFLSSMASKREIKDGREGKRKWR